MKKFMTLFAVLFVLVLAACGTSTDKDTDKKDTAGDKEATKEEKVIKIGASSVPHAEILEEAKPLLKEKGIDLEIETYQDYILPNEDLSNGTLDANFFQHIPYLEDQIATANYKFDHIGGIHIEPMGVYSKNIKSIDDIKKGTEVILSRSVSDHGRILELFETNGLIKLDEKAKKSEATVKDIVENKLDLTFSADVDPALLPEMYDKEADALVAINTNYAIEAGLKPLDDALFIEGDKSPYVNVIVVRSEDKDNKELNELVDVLHSEEIQNFIKEKYKGAVVPVNGN